MSLEKLIPKFKFDKVLDSNPLSKKIALLGSIDFQPAIITVEKSHFTFDENTDNGNPLRLCDSEYSCINAIDKIKTSVQNDIYYWGVCTLKQEINKNPTAQLNLIWPATPVHIKKYSEQKFHVIEETPELYEEYVEPYIQTMIGDRIKWVKNILHDGAEAERIVYNDLNNKDGFVLLPDMKWDGVNIDALYLVAIFYRDDIKSLRDLNITHQDWLKKLNKKIRKTVSQVYNGLIAPDELRLFIHYQPSYYHFHIHVVNVLHSGLGNGIAVGKAILLEDVIDQLSYLGEEGFKKRTITYLLGENHDLWKTGLKDAHYKALKEKSEI